MPFRVQNLALLGLAGAVLAGLVALMLGVRSEPALDVDEGELERARTEHQRASASASTPPPAARPASAVTSAGSDDGGDEDTFRAIKDPPGIPQPTAVVKGVTLSPGTEEFVAAMDDANKLYDRGDYMGAVEAAEALIEKQPNNVRMLRIAVSGNCILGNADQAASFFAKLPERDQDQMAARCSRYGVELGAE